MSEKLSTDILFQEIERNGEVDREKIEFVSREEILLENLSQNRSLWTERK